MFDLEGCGIVFNLRALIVRQLHGFPVLSSFPGKTMSGIQNIDGGQHCYANSILQCLSVNQILYTDLQKHNINHVVNVGKYN